MIKGKHIFWGLGSVGLVWGGTYLLKLGSLSTKLEIVTKTLIHKIKWTGLTLRVDAMLKNPTAGNITVTHPFVKMQYKGKTFATSKVQNKEYAIVEFSEQPMDTIYIDLDFISLAQAVPDLLREYRTKGNLSIDLLTQYNIKGIPKTQEKFEKITIGNGEQKS